MRFPRACRAELRFSPRASVLALALGLLAVAGCGGSSYSSSSSSSASTSTSSSTPTTAPAAGAGAGQALSLAANKEGQLRFDSTSLTAKAGKVMIAFSNPAPLEHSLTIATAAGATVGSTPTFQGGSKTLSVELKPGTYKFYCSVPGHRQAGMAGTLTVH